MKTIELTQGKSVKVSDEDYEYLNQWKWCYDRGYAVRSIGIKKVSMYKVILERMGITLKKKLKIRDKLDYCREVLVPPLDLSPGPKEIPLTQGKVVIVDLEDYEYLMQWNWCYNNGYATRLIKHKTIFMHRIILERMGFKNFEDTDHINHIKHDNRRSNLRPATHSQNLKNRNKGHNCSSKYKGVCWDKANNKWRAGITINGKSKRLGRFDSEIEAAKAYNKAAKKYFTVFARLNLIPSKT